MKLLYFVLLFFLFSMARAQFPEAPPFAESHLSSLYEEFREQGVPEPALRRIFEFLLEASGKRVLVKTNEDSYSTLKLANIRYAGVADFSLPSNIKRFYLLDLKQGTVERYYVSHGKNSGGKWAGIFSNKDNSHMSSLGLYMTGYTYKSAAFGGQALKIFGLDPTNDNAFSRSIVVHQASYMTPEFMAERKTTPGDTERMGRSFGCFAFDPSYAPEIIQKLRGGALLYAYTKGVEKLIAERADYQVSRMVKPQNDHVISTEIEDQQRENFNR